MQLSPASEAIITATAAVVAEHADQITATFYPDMFEAHPELLNIFNTANQAIGEQPKALAASVVAFAVQLIDPAAPDFTPVMQRIAYKHVSLGIQATEYTIVEHYLMKAVKTVLGDAVTPEVGAAWDEVYWLFATTLIAEEARLYALGGTDPGHPWRDYRVVERFEEADEVFSLLLADFFDTMGTAMAVAKQGEFLTEDGNVEDIRPILVVDSVAAAAGGFMGVSSITTFVESTSGAADGGRTGLTSVTTGVLFILAAFFSPIVTIVSSAATCGALVYVGYLMMSEASEIDWSDVSQGFPAFMIVAGVPFTYSISAGIGLGFIAYVVVALFKGEASKIKPLMWVAALAFLVYFFVA